VQTFQISFIFSSKHLGLLRGSTGSSREGHCPEHAQRFPFQFHFLFFFSIPLPRMVLVLFLLSPKSQYNVLKRRKKKLLYNPGALAQPPVAPYTRTIILLQKKE
jgi:hypothetical protein